MFECRGTAAAFSDGNAGKHMLVNRIAVTLVKEAKDVVSSQVVCCRQLL
jgi:hypothetical protein